MYESKVSSEHDFHGGITFFTFIILVGGGRASRHAARYIISRNTLLSGVHQEQLIRKTALISKFNELVWPAGSRTRTWGPSSPHAMALSKLKPVHLLSVVTCHIKKAMET